MLTVTSNVQIYLCTAPTDMRKSFDGLSALVASAMNKDVLSGHLFLFLNRRRDRVKLMWWDRDGLAVFYKNLESYCPHFFLFTEFGRNANNLARRPVAVGGMDSVSTRSGPRRRPMPSEITVPAPPRAEFPAIPEVSSSCGVA